MDGETRTRSTSGGEKGVKPEVFDQFPVEPLLEVARTFGYGAEKYEAHNFRRGYEWSKSFNAMQRHLWAFWSGQDIDPESGREHLAHAAWHCLCLMSFAREHPEFDDRYSTQQRNEKVKRASIEIEQAFIQWPPQGDATSYEVSIEPMTLADLDMRDKHPTVRLQEKIEHEMRDDFLRAVVEGSVDAVFGLDWPDDQEWADGLGLS